MPEQFSLHGKIPLKAPVPPDFIKRLRDARAGGDIAIEHDKKGATLHLDIESTSIGARVEIEEILRQVAERFARETAVLYAEGEDRYRIYVGPAGADLRKARIEDLQSQIGDMQREIDATIAEASRPRAR